jgi:hypothetical protein
MTASLAFPHPARTQTQPLEIRGRLHAFLPEPVPNRAEALVGIDLAHWLCEVIASDDSGFTVLAGGGLTFILLYTDKTPIAASLAGHGVDTEAEEAVQELLRHGTVDVFALTYKCEPAVALALSSLFAGSGPRLRMDADPRALATCLAAARGERASGALVIDAGTDTWSVLLLVDGTVVAGYGADDRSLKPGIDDATVLLHLDQLWVTRLAPNVTNLSAALAEPDGGNSPVQIDAAILDIETALIGLLARLEHQLTLAGDSDSHDRSALVATAFSATHSELDLLPNPPESIAFLVPVPADAILSELIEQFQERIAEYVRWLAHFDDASSRFLHDATSELAQQARSIVRR